jgi:mRNA-degrading endonuclease RelE of RelBE toxin-antitoxin system
MKYVREHINEKFTDESDPIKDMGIGFKDSIDVSQEKINYQKYAKKESIKLKIKIRKEISEKLRKKLIGKIITGKVLNENTYRYYNKPFRIAKIRVVFSAPEYTEILYIYVYSNKGTLYRLLHEDYKLTI